MFECVLRPHYVPYIAALLSLQILHEYADNTCKYIEHGKNLRLSHSHTELVVMLNVCNLFVLDVSQAMLEKRILQQLHVCLLCVFGFTFSCVSTDMELILDVIIIVSVCVRAMQIERGRKRCIWLKTLVPHFYRID